MMGRSRWIVSVGRCRWEAVCQHIMFKPMNLTLDATVREAELDIMPSSAPA